MKRLGWLAAALLLFGAGAAQASQQGVEVMKSWKEMDVCARKAQAAYPDYTAESNAKRDAALKRCLAAHNLPPRQPLEAR